MKLNNSETRMIWYDIKAQCVRTFDQTQFPHAVVECEMRTREDATVFIKDMIVRGAPLIGATAAYGVALSMFHQQNDTFLHETYSMLLETRPTAINLRWALDRLLSILLKTPQAKRIETALQHCQAICDEDVAANSAIGNYGSSIIQEMVKKKGGQEPIHILTHCNAGWFATVDWGTALAPVYKAYNQGIPIHVWVDETRPRNQGAQLTAFELQQHGVPHTLIVDNTGGHLMQTKQVDACFIGADRVTTNGDVYNKIGTYLKALAAKDNQIPFYVCMPSSTIDWNFDYQNDTVPIELRDAYEVTHVYGKIKSEKKDQYGYVQICPDDTPAANYAFDKTPADLITAFITEKGILEASKFSFKQMFQKEII